MIVVTTETILQCEIAEALGIVSGSMVQSKHLGRDIMAGLKSIFGGEIMGYTEMLEEARAEARARLEENARAMGGDGIVCMRHSTSTVSQGMSEIFAYGTAVKFKG
jgi:uncharacterized protein YbjQ (UPF0145 family)